MDISWATNLKFTDFNIYIHKVQDRSFRSHTNVLFSSVRMCKWNGDKHWTKQDIQRVFWNIQLNNAHKIGVFYYEWNFLSTWFLSAGVLSVGFLLCGFFVMDSCPWPLYSINNGTDMSIVFCGFSLFVNIKYLHNIK